MPFRNRWTGLPPAIVLALLATACGDGPHDLLIRGGTVHDGSDGEPFLGDADAEGAKAEETVNGAGLIGAHSVSEVLSQTHIGRDWRKRGTPNCGHRLS